MINEIAVRIDKHIKGLLKKVVVNVLQNSQVNANNGVLNLLKIGLHCRCFLANFARFFKTATGVIHFVRTQNFPKY